MGWKRGGGDGSSGSAYQPTLAGKETNGTKKEVSGKDDDRTWQQTSKMKRVTAAQASVSRIWI